MRRAPPRLLINTSLLKKKDDKVINEHTLSEHTLEDYTDNTDNTDSAITKIRTITTKIVTRLENKNNNKAIKGNINDKIVLDSNMDSDNDYDADEYQHANNYDNADTADNTDKDEFRISLKSSKKNPNESFHIKNMYKIFSQHVMMYFNYIIIPIDKNNCVHNMTPQEIINVIPELIDTSNNIIIGNLTKSLKKDWHKMLSNISINFREYVIVSNLANKFHISLYLNDLDTDENISDEFLNSQKLIFTMQVRLNDSEFRNDKDKYLITYCEKEIYEFLLEESSSLEFTTHCSSSSSSSSSLKFLLRPYFMPSYYKEISEEYKIKITNDLYSIRHSTKCSDNEEADSRDHDRVDYHEHADYGN